MAAIVVDQLTKRFGRTTAVSNLSFEVVPGRVTGFLGPNGAGKTTTMRCVLGLTHPSSGSTTIGGRPYRDLDVPLQQVGAVLENAGFYPGRSGRDHLRMVARLAGRGEERIDELLELVRLTDAARRGAGKYSLGMKQRLGLAAALVTDPSVLVLDEPANGLDPAGISWLRDLLRDRAERGMTIFVSSHVLAEVSQLADDVVILSDGRLIAKGPVRELLEGAATRSVVRSSDNARLAQLFRQRGVDVGAQDDAMTIEARPEEIGDIALESGIAIYALAVESRSLESVFLEMTGPNSETGT